MASEQSKAAPRAETFECAICWGETPLPSVALPCCTAPAGSTMVYCTRCIEVICEQGPAGTGRCPTCRAFLRVGAAGGFEISDRVETCAVCCQPKTIVGEVRGGHPVCDACLMGLQAPLRYECEGCQAVQTIAHPMYRYQPSPTEFGNDTWACHGRCGTFTRWRIVAADAARVPPEDAPESWGRRDVWLDRVREQRRRELAAYLGSTASSHPVLRFLAQPLVETAFIVGLVLLATYIGW